MDYFSEDSEKSKGNVIEVDKLKLVENSKAIWKCNAVNLSRYYIFGRLAWLDRTAPNLGENRLWGRGIIVIITSLYTTKAVFTEEGTA